MTTFDSFEIDARLKETLKTMGFENPTPIQAQAIPLIVEGKDVIGRARTGSGKTAAFGLPLLNMVCESKRKVQALVLTPTRELAIQVAKALTDHAKGLPTRILTIYGGASYTPQLRGLSSGVDVVVGTPGRVIDHLKRGTLNLSSLRLLVLDEADEMLRMGFVEDVEHVLSKTPEGRQVALFSATMPREIQRVAKTYLNSPIEVQVENKGLNVDHIQQRWIQVPERQKYEALVRVLSVRESGATLVFAQTRRNCAELSMRLGKQGFNADAIHGDLNQAARERVLGRLRSGKLDILIATDVASRGIDVNNLNQVINFDFPRETESYVHRIGRTGRAGRAGVALSLVVPYEKRRLFRLQHQLKTTITQYDPPTDLQIAEHRRLKLLRILKSSSLDLHGAQVAKDWIDELVSTDEWDLDTLALAAFKALAEASGVLLEPLPEDSHPRWAKPVNGTAPKKKPTPLGVGLAIPKGRKNNLTPAEVVTAMTEAFGIPAREIGKITILNSKTLVTVKEKAAEAIFSGKSDVQLKLNDEPTAISILTRRPPPQKRKELPLNANSKKDRSFKNKSKKKSRRQSRPRK